MLKLPKNSLFFLLHLPSFGPLVSIHGHETQFITNLCMWLPFQLCCVLLMELWSNAPTPDTSVIIYILSISKCMCQPQTALNLKPTCSTDSLGFTCSSQMHLKYPIRHAQIQPPLSISCLHKWQQFHPSQNKEHILITSPWRLLQCKHIECWAFLHNWASRARRLCEINLLNEIIKSY